MVVTAATDKAEQSETFTALSPKKIVAIVVSYNPDRAHFFKLLEALLPQVDGLIVVDNASSCNISAMLDFWAGQNIELLQLPENMGIAAATNVGIKRAMQVGADFVLLSDQDSVPSKFMVSELFAVIMSAQMNLHYRLVAAAGPSRVDSRTRQESFFMVNQAGIPRNWKRPADPSEFPPFVEVEFLIASGTLIPIDVIKSIGAMRSNYFIDHVDREWCFRAKAAGYRLLGVPASRLEHKIGDSIKQVWLFRKLEIGWHAPLRNYYLFRNAVLMLSDVPTSFMWKLYFVLRLTRYAGGILLVSANRLLRFRLLILGLRHGCKGIGGRLDVATNQCSPIPVSEIEPAFLKRDYGSRRSCEDAKVIESAKRKL